MINLDKIFIHTFYLTPVTTDVSLEVRAYGDSWQIKDDITTALDSIEMWHDLSVTIDGAVTFYGGDTFFKKGLNGSIEKRLQSLKIDDWIVIIIKSKHQEDIVTCEVRCIEFFNGGE